MTKLKIMAVLSDYLAQASSLCLLTLLALMITALALIAALSR